jgi:hypothetical protein
LTGFVGFEEAQTVFYDDLAILIENEEADEEERFVMLGMSTTLRVLIVCHCFRENDDVIRIFSARKAGRQERRDYDTRWK